MKALQNMIQFSRDSHRSISHNKARLLFISSISTVGNTLSVLGERFVPETPIENDSISLDLGYAKAKLVCEKMIERASGGYLEIEAAYVRVGQIAGSYEGFWNADEHFAALVASSQKLRRLPDLIGVSHLPFTDLTYRLLTFMTSRLCPGFRLILLLLPWLRSSLTPDHCSSYITWRILSDKAGRRWSGAYARSLGLLKKLLSILMTG